MSGLVPELKECGIVLGFEGCINLLWTEKRVDSFLDAKSMDSFRFANSSTHSGMIRKLVQGCEELRLVPGCK